MEGHAGPVTKATMEEIRRDAPRGSSNFRMNSLGSPVADSILGASPEKSLVSSAPLTPCTLEDRHSPSSDKASIEQATPQPNDMQEGEFPMRTTSALAGMTGLPSIDTSPGARTAARVEKINSAVTVDSDKSIGF
ncbi:hypothetical protein EC988_003581, partial [Linderina pennispora]